MKDASKFVLERFKEQPAVEWTHSELQCCVLGGALGGMCGYVELPRNGKLLKACKGSSFSVWKLDDLLDVHGGVTFVGNLVSGNGSKSFAVGFDTCHFNDFSADMKPLRTLEYVVHETNKLAKQILDYERS